MLIINGDDADHRTSEGLGAKLKSNFRRLKHEAFIRRAGNHHYRRYRYEGYEKGKRENIRIWAQNAIGNRKSKLKLWLKKPIKWGGIVIIFHEIKVGYLQD